MKGRRPVIYRNIAFNRHSLSRSFGESRACLRISANKQGRYVAAVRIGDSNRQIVLLHEIVIAAAIRSYETGSSKRVRINLVRLIGTSVTLGLFSALRSFCTITQELTVAAGAMNNREYENIATPDLIKD
jgi:hypothetical protein